MLSHVHRLVGPSQLRHGHSCQAARARHLPLQAVYVRDRLFLQYLKIILGSTDLLVMHFYFPLAASMSALRCLSYTGTAVNLLYSWLWSQDNPHPFHFEPYRQGEELLILEGTIVCGVRNRSTEYGALRTRLGNVFKSRQ